MKILLLISCLVISGILYAVEIPQLRPSPPRAWLGLEVSKPDPTITAHLPSLPPGIGFVVRTIDKDGPAAAAGLQELDIIWRIGDQMLINEGQLAVLLRLSKPGEEIKFAGFRSGKPLDFTLKLGEVPASKNAFPGNLLDAAILPVECGGPMRVVNVSEKTASYTTNDGRAEVRRDGPVYHVKINAPSGEIIHQGNLPPNGSLEQIPTLWQRRVEALRRGLDHALDGRITPSRQPRPRVVPPPATQP